MENEKNDLLTTGQAAKICAVTPDTVLKWIKKGRLPATRTAGGHYRVSRRDLEPWAGPSVRQGRPALVGEELPEVEGQEVTCWEYLSENGRVRADCRDCVVYRVRATRCFLMAGMETDVGHSRKFCHGSCEDCVYFRRLQGLSTKVLFITGDDQLVRELECAGNGEMVLRFARNGYEASTLVEDFRPAVVVIDVENLSDLGTELLDSLSADPRVSGIRVILVVPPGMAGRIHQRPRHRLVSSIMEKPLVCELIYEVVQGTVRKDDPARHRSA
jgi:excisionase family DNA binding protein